MENGADYIRSVGTSKTPRMATRQRKPCFFSLFGLYLSRLLKQANLPSLCQQLDTNGSKWRKTAEKGHQAWQNKGPVMILDAFEDATSALAQIHRVSHARIFIKEGRSCLHACKCQHFGRFFGSPNGKI